ESFMAEESPIPNAPVRISFEEKQRRFFESVHAYEEEVVRNPELLAEHEREMELWDNCLPDGLDPEDEEEYEDDENEEDTDDDGSPH
ncbi:MAG: hypothetical protein Q8R32_03490, partial [bacterium]|nr:hypothetical protein [bacterium]